MLNIHLLDRTLSYHLFILDLICFMYKCRFNVDFGDGVALILISLPDTVVREVRNRMANYRNLYRK